MRVGLIDIDNHKGKKMGAKKDLIGQKFGRLLVLKEADPVKGAWGENLTRWLCKCDCGKEKIVRASELLNNRTLSCGCLGRENRIKAHKKHGLSKERIYHIYLGMIDRCYDEKSDHYKNYGKRGIMVCDDWKGENGAIRFKEWAINNGYSETLTLDRINVNGNYEPNNCRWITARQQQNNKRTNVFITYKEETHTLKEWSEIIGIKYTTLKERRKRGWSVEKMFSTPTDKRFSHTKDKT